ncbi:MAG: sulfotransferase family 2 domain-containing protein [Cyanobacteria bacterium]|nr:sulfotransferase family 2 domain-containing protein [Cyanobacteriota bacterium]
MTIGVNNSIECAVELHKNGKIEQAEEIYRQILNQEPKHADALHLLGLVHLERKELDQARKMILGAIETEPISPRYHFSMGNVCREEKKWDEAIDWYNKTLTMQPMADARNNKGVALMSKSEPLAAMLEFAEAVKLNPDHFMGMKNLGKACMDVVRNRLGERLIPGDPLTREEFDSVLFERRMCEYLYCPQYRFLYAPIPKVACSSFKMIIYKLFKQDIPELIELPTDRIDRNFHIIVDRCFSIGGYRPEEARRIMSSEEIFKFTVVRNPFDRIASGFLNKFVTERTNRHQWEHTAPVMLKVFGPNPSMLDCNITFRQFVHYLCTNTIEDKHWLPMHVMVDPSEMDMVIPMESLKEDYEKLRQRLNMPLELPHMNRSSRAKLDGARGAYADVGVIELSKLSALPTTAQMYDLSLENMVRNRYKQDFEMFGYCEELKER